MCRLASRECSFGTGAVFDICGGRATRSGAGTRPRRSMIADFSSMSRNRRPCPPCPVSPLRARGEPTPPHANAAATDDGSRSPGRRFSARRRRWTRRPRRGPAPPRIDGCRRTEGGDGVADHAPIDQFAAFFAAGEPGRSGRVGRTMKSVRLWPELRPERAAPAVRRGRIWPNRRLVEKWSGRRETASRRGKRRYCNDFKDHSLARYNRRYNRNCFQFSMVSFFAFCTEAVGGALFSRPVATLRSTSPNRSAGPVIPRSVGWNQRSRPGATPL